MGFHAKHWYVVGSVETLVFLPGASGNKDFWRPVAEGLSHRGRRLFMGWPGFGATPADPGVRGIPDLVSRVVAQIQRPAVLFAQSMGGVIAIRAALQRPDLVRCLVLSVTSGGLDVSALGGVDWRQQYRDEYPRVPAWFMEHREDLTDRLREIEAPVLLLWGDADPISPPAVGRRLAELLPQAELVILEGGDHDLAQSRASEVLPHIERHLARALLPH